MNNRLGQIVTKIERKKTTCGKVMLPKICKINNFLIFFNVMRICMDFWIIAFEYMGTLTSAGGRETLADNLTSWQVVQWVHLRQLVVQRPWLIIWPVSRWPKGYSTVASVGGTEILADNLRVVALLHQPVTWKHLLLLHENEKMNRYSHNKDWTSVLANKY